MDTLCRCHENIVLIGFMGSGKSTVGRLVAKRSSRYFLDTDTLIELQEGMSVTSIFEERGESFFRNLEYRCAQWLAACVSGAVVSTGGGMPSVAAAELKRIGTIVYLKLPFEKILERLSTQERVLRPLFFDKESAEALYMEREKIYASQADITIDASASIDRLADEILEQTISSHAQKRL